MPFVDEIRQLLENKLVIRGLTKQEQADGQQKCILCGRNFFLHGRQLCLSVGEEGAICLGCGSIYASAMVERVSQEQSANSGESFSNFVHRDSKNSFPDEEAAAIALDIEALSTILDELSRAVARGIVEAPSGHIGLIHYAKGIIRPPKKPNESDKDYELRVKTYRINHLYDTIHKDTVGRLKALIARLEKSGFVLRTEL